MFMAFSWIMPPGVGSVEPRAGAFPASREGVAYTERSHGHGALHPVADLGIEGTGIDGADGNAGAIGLADDGLDGVAGIGVGVETRGEIDDQLAAGDLALGAARASSAEREG